MANKKYWQNFSELNETERVKALAENEFGEDLPTAGTDQDNGSSMASRRDFLKYLGFSTAAAAVAASCEMPVRKAIPFVNKPHDIVPGIADYYATTYVCGGEAIPVLAKVRDGRPIKIEPNSTSRYIGGGTSARAQASVLDLYDMARQRFPMANGNAIGFGELDNLVTQGLSNLGGASIVLLTGTINSPSALQVIQQFLGRYPGSRHVQYDVVSYSGMLLANEASFGSRSIPHYNFGAARVIVNLGADFLGTWLNPVEFQRAFASTRRVTASNPTMSKLYQFESMMSLTGASSDERFTHKPSETGAVAVALLNAVNGQSASGITNEKLRRGIEKAAADLRANQGGALVVSGSNNPQVQLIVNAINQAIGAYGTTIDWSAPLQVTKGIDSEMATLVADMEAGRVGAVILYDVNPVYDFYDGQRFANALKKLKVSVSMNYKLDETAELCKFIAPSHHFLESWGDAEPRTGFISMMQPTIYPLFTTRQFQDSLLRWTGSQDTFDQYFRTYWTGRLGSVDTFHKALQDGVIEPATLPSISGGSFNGGAVAAAATAVGRPAAGGNFELVLYQNVGVGDGRHANNPWLQELPDPITRATWDNFAMISPKVGKDLLNVDISRSGDADKFEVHPEKPVLSIKVGNKEVKVPALIVPGMNDNTIAIAVGYGRNSASGKAEDTAERIGRAVVGAGQNVFPLATFNGTTIEWMAPNVTVSKTGEVYDVAQVQTHSSYEGRHSVVQEMSLDQFRQNPNKVLDERARELKPWGGLEKFESDGTLYPMHDKPGIRWGMSIDLNACFGCGACVVACHSENNVPVVGKNEVQRFHDMHWLRIDRYFTGNPNDPESIQTIFQPMLCQHCDNAPCENVCPVAATTHSSEGINQMIYNRCIGTRYCANNCPYKVRRFNWADYTGADSFGDNQPTSGVGALNDAVFQMNDNLTRMVLNPDVTVRSRGVMEKCTFCVQRLQEGKLKAKKENRPLVDGDVSTACAQACPANAIVFGNANDKSSMVYKNRLDNRNRVFYVLEQIHTLPNVSYLARVRNAPFMSVGHEDQEFHGNDRQAGEGHGEQPRGEHGAGNGNAH